MNSYDTDLNLSMFRAYDIRTPSELLTPKLSERLAHAIAYYFRNILKTNKVVLCRDARLSGAQYLEQGVDIFKSLGFEVLVYPLESSACMFYFNCMQHMDAAGIIYGASHNPGKDTGQKIVEPGLIPIAMNCGPEGGLRKIKEFYIQGVKTEKRPGGCVKPVNYFEKYVDYSMKLAKVSPGDLSGLKIIMDFLSGTAGFEFAYAFEIAGAEVTVRNLVPNGFFPSGAPNPVIREAVQPTLDMLIKGDFQLGFCFDGDGDRMDIYDSNGVQLNPCFNVSVLAPGLKKIFEDAFGEGYVPQFYADLKANPLAVIELAKKGFGVHMIRNGHSQIKNSLMKNFSKQFIGAVEESGHYYLNFPLNIDDNTAFVATENTLFYGLLTARTWYDNPEKYSEAMNIQNRTCREREWGYKFPDNTKRNLALNEIEEEFIKLGGKSKKNMADGTDLEAVIMRKGLPFEIDISTEISGKWVQICQRISQSEEGLARWEVLASTQEEKDYFADMIDRIARKYTDSGKYIG